MSSTNVTEFYGLTQYVGSDKPSFTDNNEAYRALDAALHGAVAGVEDASDAITTLTGRVGDVEAAVTGLSGTVGTQKDAITALQNKEISQDGDIAEVKAAALDMVCAFNEEAAQSVHAYAIGEFFRYNDVLYKASAVINIGDTIIPNTNCIATNVTEQLLNDVDKVGDLTSLTTTNKSSAVAAINEVNTALNKGSVEVTADGVKTNSQLFDELHALVNASKVSKDSALYYGEHTIYHIILDSPLTFSCAMVDATNGETVSIITVNNTGSTMYIGRNGTQVDNSSAVPANGNKIKLVY